MSLNQLEIDKNNPISLDKFYNENKTRENSIK